MTDESRWCIDTGTRLLTGPDIHRPFTVDEWAQQSWPPCPVCGAPVTADYIATPELEGGWIYQATGQWTCGHGCHHAG